MTRTPMAHQPDDWDPTPLRVLTYILAAGAVVLFVWLFVSVYIETFSGTAS